MSNFTTTWPEILYRAFLGFVIAAVISPLIAHIPPHIKWLSWLAGLVAALALGVYHVVKTVKANKNDGAILLRTIPTLIFYIVGGAIGGLIGALAAHNI